eukprot:768590-Hanusia_phi.AAC.10
MEEENEYDKLLSELDDIESSPIRPWKSINHSKPQEAGDRSTRLKAPAPKKEFSWDEGDLGDEIEGLLGELDQMAASKTQQACTSAPPPAAAESLPFKCTFVCMGAAEEQGLRPQMEDKHVLVPDFYPKTIENKLSGARAFCAVFDGHSGSQISDYAAGRMPALLALEAWYHSPITPDSQVLPGRQARHCSLYEQAVNKSLKTAFEKLDSEIMSLTMEGSLSGGSTANVAILLADSLHVANLGDSRAVLCRNGFAMVNPI